MKVTAAVLLVSGLVLLMPLSSKAQDSVEKKLNFNGDFRYRFEQDWNSVMDDGTYRNDRFRMRFRLRLGFTYQLNEFIQFGGRLRSGVPTNMQSPQITIGYNGFASTPITIDKAFLAGKYKSFWFWAGKNTYPFWKQNELFWDDDVNPEGITVGAKFIAGNLKLNPTAGYYMANQDQFVSYPDASIVILQLASELKMDERAILDLAVAYHQLNNIFDVPEHLGGTIRIDYKFIATGARFTYRLKNPVEVGLDYVVNVEDYAGNADIPDHYEDEKTGFVAHLQVGENAKKGDWLIGYYYAIKKKYSVVDYYCEDDWVRWGNIDRNRNTNYSGHEFRFAYTFAPKFNVVLRAYTVESLVKRLENGAVANETGNRVRLDFDIKF